MSKDDLIKIEAVITEAHAGDHFSAKMDDGRIIPVKLSGRLKRFHIRVMVGDRITLGLSPYDLSHGLILSRERIGRPGLKRI